VVSCSDGTKDEDNSESCNLLSSEREPEPQLDGPDESTRFTPLNNFFIMHNNTQQELPSTLGVGISVSQMSGRK
jgi:hypothetical protein